LVVLTQAVLGDTGIHENTGERIVDFMRHPSGQLSQGCHFLRLNYLGGGFFKFILHGKNGTQILIDANRGHFCIIFINNGRIEFHRNLFTTGIQDGCMGAQQLSFPTEFPTAQLFHDVFGRSGRIEAFHRYPGNGLPLGISEKMLGRRVHEEDVGIPVCHDNGNR